MQSKIASLYIVSIQWILIAIHGMDISVNHQLFNTDTFSIYPDTSPASVLVDTSHTTPHNEDIEFFSATYGDQNYNIYGYKPKNEISDGHPLYVHLPGTSIIPNDYWNTGIQFITQYMTTNNGSNFVSVSIEYGSNYYPLGCSAFIPKSWNNKARSLWDISDSQSAISVLCNQVSFINCDKGIAISGYSQGSQLATQAAKYGLDEAVTALFLMSAGDELYFKGKPFLYYDCLSFHSFGINQNKIRSIIQEKDYYFGETLEGVRRQQISVTNRFECDHDHDLTDNDSEGQNCIDPYDGSGFYIVNEQLMGMNHCYGFHIKGCFQWLRANEIEINAESEEIWEFKANMKWLTDMVNRKQESQMHIFKNNGRWNQVISAVQNIVKWVFNRRNKDDSCHDSANVIIGLLFITVFLSFVIIFSLVCFVKKHKNKYTTIDSDPKEEERTTLL